MRTYIVVTNDALELPLSGELKGGEEVARFCGVSASTVYHWFCRGFPKRVPYKVLILEERQIKDYNEYKREQTKKWSLKTDRTEYFKEWYRKKKLKRQTANATESV